ncbi:type 1 periplasmic-binding domain-containing protein [Parachryseolinea silvisoli]|uniref:hypothetical protein n=1 Tax=Parachryseolinea silvisoli TaxID=2873601 RepID=UPI002265CFC0|nr:hypothetical protein [Parachryseolinea silvisoli]MCD9015390.1 hypothetical protein [Parachryseolinea silvisoli]
MRIRAYSFCLVLFVLTTSVYAQLDYNKQFFNAKQLFREGKYNLAMESFKPLIPYDQRNPYAQYASFYYGLAAYKQGFPAVAKDQFNQLKTQHATWEKIDEVNFWLAKIYFDGKDYFQGMKLLAQIKDKKLQPDVEALKTKALSDLQDAETLRMMREEYPKDETIGKLLAAALAKDLTDPESRTQLEALVDQLHLKKTEYIPEAPKSYKKDIYTVSVLMPFMVQTLEPSPGRKKNQIVLDFYEGMKQAVDTLAKQGVKISLRAYDTERSTTKLRTALALPELKSTDLLVGPFFHEENPLLKEFSQQQKINLFNPLANSSDLISNNPYGYLFQPSEETLGQKAGAFVAAHARKKNCIVYYGTSRRDSVLAANFIQQARQDGVKILSSQRIAREGVAKILTTLATPTEYDEFKYPKQFTLKKDSLGSIFVATDEALIYTKVLSGVETRGDSVLVIGSESWLDQPTVDLEKYNILPIVLEAPNYAQPDAVHYRAFFHKYVHTHGRTPSAYARMGYEFMLFAGLQLRDNGVYFQDGLSRQAFVPGSLTTGYNYQFSHDNQLVPFIRFRHGKATVVDKR